MMFRRKVFLASLLLSACFGIARQALAAYSPPVGFTLPVTSPTSDNTFTCPATPPSFTDALVFRSKYEGSDGARATLNHEAERAYRTGTKNVNETERLVSRLVTRYAENGDVLAADCAVRTLQAWAAADALTSTRTNHTGKSVRKWALASFSSAWLQLKFSPAQPLKNHAQAATQIERWLSRLGTLTMDDWNHLPLAKVNNHSYWAAWALMATAVVTERGDLFERAVAVMRTGLHQVDENGFLPNELKRKQRALAYHNYALQPLVMLVVFARENHVVLTDAENAALTRLAQRVIEGIEDPSAFNRAAGAIQDRQFLDSPTNLAWLEGWCAGYACSPALLKKRDNLRPLTNYRLGGDLTRLLGSQTLAPLESP